MYDALENDLHNTELLLKGTFGNINFKLRLGACVENIHTTDNVHNMIDLHSLMS